MINQLKLQVKNSLISTVFSVMVSALMLFSSLIFSASVFAAADVSIKVIAEKDIVEVNKKGKKIKKRVIAADSVPGDVLFFTINYSNKGDEPAINAQIDNPIPAGATYKSQSAVGENSQILFSVDGGKSFKTASNLTYESKDAVGKVTTREALPEEYNAIRWIISDIPKGGKGSVGFSAVVK
jgi:uncharacterized repeat protein (TIGR01451 family)